MWCGSKHVATILFRGGGHTCGGWTAQMVSASALPQSLDVTSMEPASVVGPAIFQPAQSDTCLAEMSTRSLAVCWRFGAWRVGRSRRLGITVCMVARGTWRRIFCRHDILTLTVEPRPPVRKLGSPPRRLSCQRQNSQPSFVHGKCVLVALGMSYLWVSSSAVVL